VSLVTFLDPVCNPVHLLDGFIAFLAYFMQELTCKAYFSLCEL
jgi:hypothetical protein